MQQKLSKRQHLFHLLRPRITAKPSHFKVGPSLSTFLLPCYKSFPASHHVTGRGNWKIHSCPFASAPTSATPPSIPPSVCPFHLWTHSPPPAQHAVPGVHAHNPRPLIDRHGDYDRSLESALLLRGVGGGQKILEMATRFYAWALVDEHLQEFFFEADGAAAHGDRLGHWIVQFMGGEGNPWDDSGREGMRQTTHVKAWNSIHRPPQRKGRHFKLDDCRIWMRLHFLAAREVGLFLFPQFQQWYVAFIAQFVRVYEVTAPPYAAADAEWSASAGNVELYLAQGRRMLDISRSFK